MGYQIRLGIPSPGFLSNRHALCLLFYLRCLFLQLNNRPINPSLHFFAFMQNMPDIPLMNTLWSYLLHCALNCLSSITHYHIPLEPLFLHLP
jgi:hypothetical protein